MLKLNKDRKLNQSSMFTNKIYQFSENSTKKRFKVGWRFLSFSVHHEPYFITLKLPQALEPSRHKVPLKFPDFAFAEDQKKTTQVDSKIIPAIFLKYNKNRDFLSILRNQLCTSFYVLIKCWNMSWAWVNSLSQCTFSSLVFFSFYVNFLL